MTIETKFNIGDLVRHKYSKSTSKTIKDGLLLAFTVLDIKTDTCIAGTQVFYICRGLFQHRHTPWGKKEGENDLIEIGIGGLNPETCKYREDELQPCPEDIVKLITGEV